MALPSAVRCPDAARLVLGGAGFFLVGGAVILFVGSWLVTRFGQTDGAGSSVCFVWDNMIGDLGLVNRASDATAPFWVRVVINLIGAAVVLGSAYLLFRTPRYTHTLDAADEARVRTLLRDFGDEDSLGYFATRRDKSVVWDTGEAGDRTGGRLLPRRRLGEPGQRQPARRPAALAGGHRGVAAPGADQRLVAGGDGRGRPRGRSPTPTPASRRGRSATRRSSTCAPSRSTGPA